jgi:hypothetical protein
MRQKKRGRKKEAKKGKEKKRGTKVGQNYVRKSQ